MKQENHASCFMLHASNMSLPIAILVSGTGTNLQAIIDAIEKGELNAEIKVVISNNPDAYALKRAERHGIERLVIIPPLPPFTSAKGGSASGGKGGVGGLRYNMEAFEEAVISELDQRGVKLVCLAGFMRVLSPRFVSAFKGRIMNIHPALLPSFPGLHAQRQAVEHGVKVSGCTVHFVDEGVDAGPIILQTAVEVRQDDTEETLAERILIEEHKLYPRAIQLFAEGRLKIVGRRVLISGGK